MATHFSILAWKTPWTEGPMGYSLWACKELDATKHSTPSASSGSVGFLMQNVRLENFKHSLRT